MRMSLLVSSFLVLKFSAENKAEVRHVKPYTGLAL